MRRRKPRYEITFTPPEEITPVVVHSTQNPDEATVLFALELQRLLADHARGELAILRKTARDANPAVVLRQMVTSP